MMKPVMVERSSESGFTLIEIILAITISASLVAIVFAGQRQLRERAQFNDSIERIVSTLNYAQNAALTTVNNSHPLAGSGSNTDTLVLGKLVQLSSCPSTTIVMSTLVRNDLAGGLSLKDRQDITTPWLTCYNPSPPVTTYIAFIRQPETGLLQVFQLNSLPANASDFDPTDPLAHPSIPLNLTFTGFGQTADIVIDVRANTITKVFQ